jgi:hypothetical protein
VGAGEREEEIRGVRARSARWMAIWPAGAEGFVMATENPRFLAGWAFIAEIEAVQGFDDVVPGGPAQPT